ncbi:MAG: hypothetical protein SNI70_09125 [Rikenellaceae bacterium]
MIDVIFHDRSEHYILDKRHSCRECQDFEYCASRLGWGQSVHLDCGRCNAHCFVCDDAELMNERLAKRKKRK